MAGNDETKPPEGDPLAAFLPPVAYWFRERLGEPTPAQVLGWPAIRAGHHCLISAPTGSGKTLAAFLACLDAAWRLPGGGGVHTLYISPLKALGQDIHRNLREPLAGIVRQAHRMGIALRPLRCCVRTGDTPPHERVAMLRRPPDILITTPESLHLLLTSQGRELFRHLRYCVVDEVHALCGNKRGVFLAVLMERLEELSPGYVRIGLSATMRPLAEAARFLGGLTWEPEAPTDAHEPAAGARRRPSVDRNERLVARPVHILDAGWRKDMVMRVQAPALGRPRADASVWPALERSVYDLIREHRSTIVFVNDRRTAERLARALCDLAGSDIARAHHGSLSRAARRAVEEELKAGRLRAVVATASLELGIDMGSVDLVCQVQSPGEVTRTLQRVGRAGHLFGAHSKGYLIATTPGDLLEQAVLAQQVLAGAVEELRVPQNCLDVLAQQVAALVAHGPRPVQEIYRLVRRAYPYHALPADAFQRVLELLAGAYRGQGLHMLRPRIFWDRVHDTLAPLPGTRTLALRAGVIPDSGQYPVTLHGQPARLGELDEEFVYERRVGDCFVLGSQTWRITRIADQYVEVEPAPAAGPATMPFWRGEKPGRTPLLGQAVGCFLDTLVARLEDPHCQAWLERAYALEPEAAAALRHYVSRQLTSAGCVPSRSTVLLELFPDPLGDWFLALLYPMGVRLHQALRLVLDRLLCQRCGIRPQSVASDDGLLMRLPALDAVPLDVLTHLSPTTARTWLIEELGSMPLFAVRFRQNALRALLLPRPAPDRRLPVYLQRLKARQLFEATRQAPDFPITVETFRQCLEEDLDVAGLEQLLADIQAGKVRVVTREADAPSPFAAQLVFRFTAAYLYEKDRVGASDAAYGLRIDTELLDRLIGVRPAVDGAAVQQLEAHVRRQWQAPRSPEEAAAWLQRIGDLADDEVDDRWRACLDVLAARGLVQQIVVPGAVRCPRRWILTEEAPLYATAFALADLQTHDVSSRSATSLAGVTPLEAARRVLWRFVQTRALAGVEEVTERYPWDAAWVGQQLADAASAGRLVACTIGPSRSVWGLPDRVERLYREALVLARRQIAPVRMDQFALFLLRWHDIQSATRALPVQRSASADVSSWVERLERVFERLEASFFPAALYETALLGPRLGHSLADQRVLDHLGDSGWAWVLQARGSAHKLWLAPVQRDKVQTLAKPPGTLGATQSATDRSSARAEQARATGSQAVGSADADDLATRVEQDLQRHGASFVHELARRLNLPPTRIRHALWDLAETGSVTNDMYRTLVRGRPPDAPITTAARTGSSASRRLRALPEGRWSLLPWGQAPIEEQLLTWAYILLHRYGVVERKLVASDPWAPPWRLLYDVYTRLEWAGAVCRGYFVQDGAAGQFALPQAVDLLQQTCSLVSNELYVVHSCDPANVVYAGGPYPGTWPEATSPARRTDTWVVLEAGVPLAWLGRDGQDVWLASTADPDRAAEALATAGQYLLTKLLPQRAGMRIRRINGQPVLGSSLRSRLLARGFVSDGRGLVLWRYPR